MGHRTAIRLTSEEEQMLRQWARAGTSEHRMVERAKVILLAHQATRRARRLREIQDCVLRAGPGSERRSGGQRYRWAFQSPSHRGRARGEFLSFA
jgi:hypothetical protein